MDYSSFRGSAIIAERLYQYWRSRGVPINVSVGEAFRGESGDAKDRKFFVVKDNLCIQQCGTGWRMGTTDE